MTVAEGTFAKGAFVVRLDQPYRNYAVDLLEPQKFPETPYTPYDDVSWAIPVHYGLEAKRIDDAKISSAPLAPVTEAVVVAGRVDGSGPVYLLKDTGQEALLAARFRLRTSRSRSRRSRSSRAPWITRRARGSSRRSGAWATRCRRSRRSSASPSRARGPRPPSPHTPRRFRGSRVWHLWSDTEATGWLRLALDQEKIPYDYIRDEEIRAGHLKEKYDVLLFGDNDESWKAMVQGIDTKWGPMPYTKTAEFPSHGVPDASNDITGGIGWAGMANLQEYLGAGGLMITLGNGSALPLEGGLVRGVSERTGAYTPGSELRVKFVRPEHPWPTVTRSRPRRSARTSRRTPSGRPTAASWSFSGARVPRRRSGTSRSRRKGRATAKDEDKDKDKDKDKEDSSLVVSGGGKNLDKLEGYPAILDVPSGKGRVIAFNFSPMHRDLNHSDYRFLWNGILNWSGQRRLVPLRGPESGGRDPEPARRRGPARWPR